MDNGFTRVNFGYATKNTPIPSKKSYLKRLIAKTGTFLRNVRWRTHFLLNPDTSTNKKGNYGFRSTKAPPQIPELKEFEDGMMSLIQNIKFNDNRNPSQTNYTLT